MKNKYTQEDRYNKNIQIHRVIVKLKKTKFQEEQKLLNMAIHKLYYEI